MIKAVVFDLDGTLLNTLEALSYCVSMTMKQFGLGEIDKRHTKEFVGEGARKLIDRALIYNGDTALANVPKAYETYNEIFLKNCLRGVKPYDGIEELLESLKSEGVKLAVLSNKAQARTEDNIYSIFGMDLFDCVYGERAGIPRKPDPAALNMILAELEISNSEALYVGDTATDMLTAFGAGCISAGVLWGFRDRKELEDNKADFIVESPDKILEIVKNINSLEA